MRIAKIRVDAPGNRNGTRQKRNCSSGLRGVAMRRGRNWRGAESPIRDCGGEYQNGRGHRCLLFDTIYVSYYFPLATITDWVYKTLALLASLRAAITENFGGAYVEGYWSPLAMPQPGLNLGHGGDR